MPYVNICEETNDVLHLRKEPGSISWGLLFALIALGFGAAYYSTDYLLWKLAYISGSVFLGLNSMEDWEECIFDKIKGEVRFIRSTLVQKLFKASEGYNLVTASLDEIVDVSVECEELKYSGNGYSVVVKFASGFSVGVTETSTIGDRTDHDSLVEKINEFLGRGREEGEKDETKDQDLSELELSDSSDDSFEQINKDTLDTADNAQDQ